MRNKQTHKYINAVLEKRGLTAENSETQKWVSLDNQLIRVHKGNTAEQEQGTWIDQELILPLALWLNPEFYL